MLVIWLMIMTMLMGMFMQALPAILATLKATNEHIWKYETKKIKID
jgi:hypothetical protein